jgi:signal transduction histidine kinase
MEKKMKTLLLVDDEAKNLSALKRIFSDQAYELCFAANGEEALNQVETHRPAVVIMDIMMPGMDGIEACSRIKERHTDIMVLLLSAKSSLEDRMKGYAAKADDYLIKPYDPDELIAKVDILMRLHTAQQALESLNRDLEATVKQRTDELVARERQALTGKMVAGIVHNLRGPLMVAQGSTQMTTLDFDDLLSSPEPVDLENSSLAARMKDNIANTYKAVNRASELVDTLLLQGGTNPREKNRPIDLNELIQEEYRFLRSEIMLKHDTAVTLDLADDLPLISGKYTDFSQVFYNLVKNACEAMADSATKQLFISSRYGSTGIQLSFSDTGPGIGPEKINRIFNPFFSTKFTDNVDGSGSGLGLFVSSRLMAGYQAFISVQDKIPSGSEFSIQIPLSNLYKETEER